ncbi:MAG: leucine-rich repeat protein [Clostridia bacterium]|nr:leucine-rich repeat protein [Clostridia bacterium]
MKKRLLRIAAYLLILIMTVTNLPMAFAAPAEYGTLQITQTNPHFAGLEAPLQITQTAPLYFSDGESTQEYYTDPADAAAVIRDAMEAREESFTVGYSVSEKVPEGEEERKAWFNSIAFDLLREKAFEETENATEGDSLRFSWRGVSLSIKYVSYPERTDISLTYNYTYFANAAQEAELTAAVDELVAEFAFTAQTTEREKIDAIYDWLCANVDYDHDHPVDYNLKFSAYAAMVHKTAVCEGYAVLFYRLAEEVGLDARVITGKATHSGENHAWNIVRLDDSYYYLDSTWDANVAPQDYAYYLRGASDFYGHTIDEKYETAEFRARYPLAINGASDSNGIELTLGDWNVLIVGRSQAIILEYLGNDANVTVPASFDLADYNVGSGVVPVEAIETNAFSDRDPVNTTIESITISEGIRSLSPSAISYCNNLKELHLPSTLQIKNYGFTSVTEVPISCNSMETVTVAEGNPYLKLENGVLYTADGTTALYCPPKNGLTTLALPNGVKVIGNEAFSHHATLRQVTLPSSMAEIGFFAFQTASALEEVTLNEGLDRIGQYAFHNCRSLQSVHLPASLKQILSGAFYEVPLRTITVDAQNDVFSMQNGMLIGEGIVYKFALSTQGEQITIPAGITEIDQGAFEGASFKDVSLPSSLQTIGQTAFRNCENLLHITIPENVARIGDMAFSGCDMLLSAVIPANVVQFGESIFHLGMTETYVTVFGEEGSYAQTYCAENEIDFKLLSTFPCANGHNVQKKEDTSNLYSYVWWWECEACGCKTHTFTKLYTSLSDPKISHALEAETHTYDGTKFTPDVLWLKFEDTLLTENVDYQVVGYGENLVPGGNNFIRLEGIGEFRGERFIPLTIERAPITNAVAVLDCYTFEYDGNAKYPAVQTLTLNGKELNRDTDFATTFEENVEVGTGYVVIRGDGNYTGELRVPFAITEHQHKWGSWSPVDELQHQRKCTVSICEYYNAPQRADHQYDDEHDGICNDCGYTRDVRISIADAVAVLNCYEYTYDGDPKQPWVETLTLNGKELTRFTDFVTAFENNTEIGTGYVVIRGNGNYTGELRVPFAIVAHQHDWTDWTSSDSTQHYRFCMDDFCDEYGDRVYQPHCYDDIHDEICNDCGYTRTDAHSFTDHYQSDEQFHWLVCDGCDKTQGTDEHSGGKATCQALAVCDDCGRAYGELGVCDWEWMMDEQYHWEKCTVCGDETEKVKHSGGTPTCTTQGNCGICGKAYGDLAEHQWYKEKDGVNHWDDCSICDAVKNIQPHSGPAPTTCGTQATCVDCSMPFGEPAGHSGGTATCTGPAVCQYCYAPYGTVAPHQWVQQAGATHHWMKCKNCDATQGRVAHSGGTATCKEQAKCSVCQKAYGELKSHQWTNACDTECNVCKATRTPAAHKGGTATCKERAKCSVCGVAYGNLAAHKFGDYVYNNDATSQKDGTKTRTCTVCGLKQTTTAAGTKIKNPFKDVKANEYYTDPVLWAVGKKITNGMSETSFAPTNECTRGQIVTFLWRAAGSPKPKSTKNPFRDVQKGAYYYDAVLWAVEKGITTGTSANTFSPDAACTRGQVVTFLHRAKGKPAATSANGFNDVQKGAYYYDAVLWAVKNGITNGMGEGVFAPDATCTRGQIVTFLYRAYN